MFDAVIIIASFALDIVFLDGVADENGEEAAALILVFLLWRILRIINGKRKTVSSHLACLINTSPTGRTT
jgi:hypothetical protein